MAQKKSKSLVYLIQNFLEVKDDTPIYYTGVKGLSSSTGDSLNINHISGGILNEIHALIINLDGLFKDQFFSLTNALSANRYLSPLYDNFLKGWKILEILKNHSKVYLLVDNDDQQRLWKEFLLSNNVQVISKNKEGFSLKIKIFAKAIISLFKEYFWIRLTRKKKELFSKIIFIEWINEKNKSYEQVINQSSYFGEFLKDIHKKESISIIGNILDGHQNFKEIIKSDYSFIKEYISFWDIVWAFFKSLRLLSSLKEKIIFKSYDFTSIVDKYFKKDFWDASYLKHLLFYKAFEKICLNVSKNSTIFYPFENQPWEKALIMACSAQTNKINLFAYQFFPIPENFLIHCFSEKARSCVGLPSRLLTSDINSDHLFQKQGVATFKLGSMRYDHLLNYQMGFTSRKKILCSLFLDKIEVVSMVKKMVKFSKHIDCDFIINYHPSLSSDIFEKIKKIVEDSKNIALSDTKVADLLDDVFLLIYNSSSVFLEAALRGIAVLYLPCDDIVNLDRFCSLGRAIKNDEEAISFIQELRVDKNFYDGYCSEVYKKANQMIIPYRECAAKELGL